MPWEALTSFTVSDAYGLLFWAILYIGWSKKCKQLPNDKNSKS